MTTRKEISRFGSNGPPLSLEALVAELSSGLVDLGMPAAEPKIHHAFEHLLRLFDLDRIALWEFSHERSEFILLHHRRTARAPSPVRQQRADPSAWATAKLLRGHPVVVHDVRDLPAAAEGMRSYLARQGIRSHLSLPLRSEGKVFGALVFASVRRQVAWNAEVIGKLQVIADIFGTALAGQRAEQARHHTEALETSILDSLPSRVAVIDRQGAVIAHNKKWAAFVSCRCGERTRVGLGADYIAIAGSGKLCCDPQQTRRGLESVLDGSLPVFETEYQCAENEDHRWYRMTVVPLAVPEGGAVVLHTDVTERKEAERERGELAGRLLRAQEVERSRIARELHDDIAQRIALLGIWMENLQDPRNGDSPEDAVGQLRREAKQLSLDVSQLSHQLHSSYLEHLGLAAAVEHQCKELATVHGVRIDCRIEDLRCTPGRDASLGLFRVLQEALRNALRHAAPTRVLVKLHADRNAVRLQVMDDGKGFDPEAVRGEGLGLASMRERLRLLGGELSITSTPRGGTWVEAVVPQTDRKHARTDGTAEAVSRAC